MLIEFSQVIVSSLRDHTIDEIIGTSNNMRPYMSKLALSLHGTSYSNEYGTLIASRAEKEKGLQIMHVQGGSAQMNDSSGRCTDTRIVYNIDPSELRKLEFKLGTVLSSLPPLEPFYENKLMGKLGSTLEIASPIANITLVESLRKHMISAIIERKRLLVSLDANGCSWQRNDLLRNTVSQCIFAALDLLPEEFRQIASVGISFDEKFKMYLNNCLFLFYQGDLPDDYFGLKDVVHIQWSDLDSCVPVVSESEVRYYRMYCRILGKQFGKDASLDLYGSEMSSREMFIGIHEIRRNIEEFENLLRFSVEKKVANIQRLFCDELLNDMTTYPLGLINSIIYSILKDNYYTEVYKKELLQQYNNEYGNVDHMFGQSVDGLLMKDIANTEASADYSLDVIKRNYPYLLPEDIENKFIQYMSEQNKFIIIHKAILKLGGTINMTPEMKDFFFLKIIEQLQSKSSSIQASQFVSIARLALTEDQKRLLINYLSNRDDLRIFEELFISKDFQLIKSVVQKGFNTWKGWNVEDIKLDRALCRPPFLKYLTPEQLFLNRRIRLLECNSYQELYAGIEYADILKLYELSANRSLALSSIIGLMSEAQKQQFINESLKSLLDVFNDTLHKVDDITKTTIWKLLKFRTDLRYRIVFKSDSLLKTICNVQRLQQENVSIDYSVDEMYDCCNNLQEVKETYSLILERGRSMNLEPDLCTFNSIHKRFKKNTEEFFRTLLWFYHKGVSVPIELSEMLVDMLNGASNFEEFSAGFELIMALNIPYSQVEFRSTVERLNKIDLNIESRKRFDQYLTSNQLIKWSKLFSESTGKMVSSKSQSEKVYLPELFTSLFQEIEPAIVSEPERETISTIEEPIIDESIIIEQKIDDKNLSVKQIEVVQHNLDPISTNKSIDINYQMLFYISLAINILLIIIVIWF